MVTNVKPVPDLPDLTLQITQTFETACPLPEKVHGHGPEQHTPARTVQRKTKTLKKATLPITIVSHNISCLSDSLFIVYTVGVFGLIVHLLYTAVGSRHFFMYCLSSVCPCIA